MAHSVLILNQQLVWNLRLKPITLIIKLLRIRSGIRLGKKDLGPLLMLIIGVRRVPSLFMILPNPGLLIICPSGSPNSEIMLSLISQSCSWVISVIWKIGMSRNKLFKILLMLINCCIWRLQRFLGKMLMKPLNPLLNVPEFLYRNLWES